MWQKNIDVIPEYFGQAVIVFGKFHIIRHLMDAIDKVRRMEAKALAKAGSEVMEGTRYIWLKNPWNLTDNHNFGIYSIIKNEVVHA